MGNSSGTLCAHVETKDQGTVKKAEDTCKKEQIEPTPQTGDLGNQGQPETETIGEQTLQELATNDGDFSDSIELETLLEANGCCGDEQDITDIIDQLVQNALNAPVLADSMANIELWSLGSANQLEATPVDKGMHNFEPDAILTNGNELSASVNGTWRESSSGGIPTTPNTPITTALMCESYEKEDNLVYLNHPQETDNIGENKVPFTIIDPNETSGEEPMRNDQQILISESKHYDDNDVLDQNIIVNKRPEPIKIPLVHEVIPRQQTALSVLMPTRYNGAADLSGNLEGDEYCTSGDNPILPRGLLRESKTLGHVVIDESSETYKYFEDVGTDAPNEHQDATTSVYVCAEEDSLDTVGLIGEFAARSSSLDHQTLDFGCQTESDVIADDTKTDSTGRGGSVDRKDSEESTQPVPGILRRRTVSQPNLEHYVNSDRSSVGESTSSSGKDTLIECAQPPGVRNIGQQTFSHPVVQVDDLSYSYGETSKIAEVPVKALSNDAANDFQASPPRIQARASFVVNISGTLSSDYPLTIDAKCEGSIRAPNVNGKSNSTKKLTPLASLAPDRSSASSSCSSSSGSDSLGAKENSENAETRKLTRNYATSSKLTESTCQKTKGRKRDEAGDNVIQNSVKKVDSVEPVERTETAMSNLLQVLESVDEIELLRVDDELSAHPDHKSTTTLGGSTVFQELKNSFAVEKCFKSITEMTELPCSSIYGDQQNNNETNGTSLSASSSVLLERLKTPESVRVDHLDELSLSRYTVCC